jgi:mono/diheme cytochrome c family protein
VLVLVLVHVHVLVLASVCGCDNHGATPDWSRMITQPKLLPYGASAEFADGRAMRPVPAGVVAVDYQPAAATFPMPITRAVLERGRARFDIACSACHGLDGASDTPVAHAMQRRRPPSLHEPRITALAPGAMYRVIVDGYGVMPSYASLLTADDRWAVIAYVRTLELANRAPLATLPPEIRDAATRRLP